MRTLRAWLVRFGGLFGRGRRERELAAELESPVQFHVEDNLRAGMPPEEARRQALIKLGGMDQTKELYRERRGLPGLESLLQDLRYAGRTLRQAPGFSVMAVMPESFNMWVFGAQAWTPLAFNAKELSPEGRKLRSFFVVGRLADGVSPQRAQAEMNTIAERLEQTYTAADKGWETKLLSLQEFEVRETEGRPALLLLMGAVGFLLLVACANIAGLLIARGSGRQQEMAIRIALGARRW